MRRLLVVMTISVVIALPLPSGKMDGQTVGLTTFRDGKHGVSFSYPVDWKVVAVKDSGFDTPFLLNDSTLHRAQPPVVVAFRPAGGTILSALEFTYMPVMADSEAACAEIGNIGEDRSPDKRTIHGVGYLHSSGGGSSAGHGMDADRYSTYRGGVCFVFEEDFVTTPGLVQNGAQRLTDAQLKAAQRRLDAVMQSVRIHEPVAVSQLHRYFDPETGVSIRYPSAWKESMGYGYGGDPLTEYTTTANPYAPKARLRVGWRFPFVEPEPDPNDSELMVEHVTFAYAVLPEKMPTACREAFEDWETDGSKDVVVHGATLHEVEYQDAGLGHSWTFVLYTAFHGGHCLGFSVGSQIWHSDDPLPFSKADETVFGDADAVFHSVRLLPVKQQPVQANPVHAELPSHRLFPEPQPISDGNPAVRHEVEVKVPTRLIVSQSDGKVSFAISPTDFETAKLSVGEKMVTGLNVTMRGYPEDKPPASPGDDILSEQVESSIDIGKMLRDYSGMASVPMTSPRMVVEADLVVFETDIPPQHMWRPKDGKQYRALWERALKYVVQR